jgi:hypothetical protein
LATELVTVDVLRPGVGKRYTGLPVDHVDVTGFHTDYTASPLRPQLIDIQVGDLVFWNQAETRMQARVDEVAVSGTMLHVAFADAQDAPLDWPG